MVSPFKYSGCVTRVLCLWLWLQAEEARKVELARVKALEDERQRLAATLLQKVLGKAYAAILEEAEKKKAAAAAKKAAKKKK